VQGLDEDLSLRQLEAIARYSLVGHIRHTATDRGDITRAIEDLTHKEVLVGPGHLRHLSRATVYRDMKRVKDGGVWSLMRTERKDKGSVHALSPAQLDALVSLRTNAPDASVPVLIRALENQGVAGPQELRPSTIRRILRDRGLSRVQARPHGRAYRRFEVDGPGDMWQGDASPGIWVGSVHAQLYAWLDAFSRTAVSARYYANQRLPAFDDCLYRAIACYGVPASAHVDNGSPYVSNHFKRVCADLDIQIVHATPYQPSGKGRIERFFRTVQDQFEASARALVDDGTIKTVDDLNDHLQRWLDEYNHRPHSSTGKTPLELIGEVRPYPDLRRLSEIFLWRETRLVSKRGEVSVGGNHYSVVRDDLVGTKVTVAYHPFDLREVYLEIDRTFVAAKPALPVRHLEHPKMTPPTKKKPTGPADYVRGLKARDKPQPAIAPSAREAVQTALASALARELRPEEHDLVTAYLARPGLVLGAQLDVRLCAFVRRHGRGQHLSRYLDAIWGEGR
jgi:transposase InsO family protein